MKRWIWPTFFVWALIGSVAIAAMSEREDEPVQVVEGKGRIAWQPDFEAAMQTARQQQKPALLVFETKECTFCKKMDKTTWVDARVQAQTRGFVPVRVDGDARTDLLAAYGVRAFPTAVLVNGNGKPFAGREGFIPPTEFVSFLETARAKWKS